MVIVAASPSHSRCLRIASKRVRANTSTGQRSRFDAYTFRGGVTSIYDEYVDGFERPGRSIDATFDRGDSPTERSSSPSYVYHA